MYDEHENSKPVDETTTTTVSTDGNAPQTVTVEESVPTEAVPVPAEETAEQVSADVDSE